MESKEDGLPTGQQLATGCTRDETFTRGQLWSPEQGMGGGAPEQNTGVAGVDNRSGQGGRRTGLDTRAGHGGLGMET